MIFWHLIFNLMIFKISYAFLLILRNSFEFFKDTLNILFAGLIDFIIFKVLINFRSYLFLNFC